jgi:hypothetical protein
MAAERGELQAVMQFGMQVSTQDDITTSLNHRWVFKNCVFDLNGYGNLCKLEDAGYVYNKGITSQLKCSKFLLAAAPAVHLVSAGASRVHILRLHLQKTISFHQNNASATLWGQGHLWASLNFMEFVKLDKSFPLLYLVAPLAGVGKTSAFNAFAKSIGLSLEAMGGNKMSESGLLDWVSTYCCLCVFIDDFNPRKCENRSQDSWADLFKQLYDAKSIIQHDKFRLVLSSAVISANVEMPQDIPILQRILTLHYHPIHNQFQMVRVEQEYTQIQELISCLIPDVVAMKWKGALDSRHLKELQQYIYACCPTGLVPRIAQNLKKPMYYLLLTFRLAEMSIEEVETHIFGYMQKLINQYAATCTQVDLWSRFIYYLARTLESHNQLSSDKDASLHWYYQLHHISSAAYCNNPWYFLSLCLL